MLALKIGIAFMPTESDRYQSIPLFREITLNL